MTNPTTHADNVPITQADRLAYLSLNMLTPDDQFSVMAANWDCTTGMQVLARHRHQALIEGARAMQEAAADICDHRCDDGEDDACCEDTAFCISADIRNLSAQAIANQIGGK